MSPTTARQRPLRAVGILLVAAALVAGPAVDAFAEPTTEPSPTASASSTAEPSPSAPTAPTASAEPSPTTSPSAEPTPGPSAPVTSPSATATRSSAATPTPSEASDERVAAASAAQLADAAAAAAPQSAYAADFVARTLAANGDHYVYPDSGGFFDGGNTIDGIIALAGSGSGHTQMGESLDYLATNLTTYIGSGAETYAGPTAKALLGVIVGGGDPRSVGAGPKADLVATLTALEGPTGRFSDESAWGDFSNTIGQSLAVIALVRAGEPVSTESVDLLLGQQCSDGGFRQDIDDDDCVSQVDTTALAAQALIAAGSTVDAGEALDWLASQQLSDGSVSLTAGTSNANATGVAAQAFAAGGLSTELARAQAFLVTLQYGCPSPSALRGGLAYSASTRSTTAPTDSDLRATPQATLGLAGQSLLSVTGEGATSGTTATPCTTTPPPTTTQPSSSPGVAQGSGSDGPGTDVDSGPTGSLAQTGSDLLLPVGVGLALVVLGALAVAASRRRGAHA